MAEALHVAAGGTRHLFGARARKDAIMKRTKRTNSTIIFLAIVGSSSCEHSPVTPRAANPRPASQMVRIEVPAGANAAPFDVPRYLGVPSGFGVRVVARVPKARFLVEAANGDVLVSQPSEGKILRISQVATGPVVNEFASGLAHPHDMVFKRIGDTDYLYLSEDYRVSRARWTASDTVLGLLEPIVSSLPNASLPELQGQYGHGLKNIAIAGETLFVSIASATNADTTDILAEPVRGSVYAYSLDGTGERLFAKGLRNAEGLAIHPVSGELWAAVNNRDSLRYPLHDGRYGFGALNQTYIDDNPPEPFTRVRDGGNYGWPYCNPSADHGTNDPPFHPDFENNADNAVLDCGSIDRVSKGLPAHSAPLGMSFWIGDEAPADFRNGALVGLHGCWNCSVPRGYKVVFLPARADRGFDDPMDFMTGFLTDPADIESAWGRPVDVIPNSAGNLYVSDDLAGAVYEVRTH